jgi:hypothetical protein
VTDHLEGIARADDRLGMPFPLPTVTLPPIRWVEVHGVGEVGAEVEWNLDDTRAGAPGRLVLYAGPDPPPKQALDDWTLPEGAVAGGHRVTIRAAPLAHAQPSLRPVTEVVWHDGDLHLRLTAQGPWEPGELLQIVASIPSTVTDGTPPL